MNVTHTSLCVWSTHAHTNRALVHGVCSTQTAPVCHQSSLQDISWHIIRHCVPIILGYTNYKITIPSRPNFLPPRSKALYPKGRIWAHTVWVQLDMLLTMDIEI